MVRTVCLDEKKHAVATLRGLQQMRQEKEHCDFTIKVAGEEFYAHKFILSLNSPYFKSMFKYDVKETLTGEVEMKDVDSECVKCCIEFMYTGSFDVPDGKMGGILHVAIMMQLEDVKNTICNILKDEMNAANFYETRCIVELYDLTDIYEQCKVFYADNFSAISTQPEFMNEIESRLVDVLKSRHMRLREQEKLAICLKWAGLDPHRTESLFELIKFIKFDNISPDYLRDVLENHHVVRSERRLSRLVSDGMFANLKKVSESMNAQLGNALKNNCDTYQLVLFNGDDYSLRSYERTIDEIRKYHEESFRDVWFTFTAVYMECYVYVLCSNRTVYRLKCKNGGWERMGNMVSYHGNRPPAVSLSGAIFVIGSGAAFPSSPSEVVETFESGWRNLLTGTSWWRLSDKPEPVADATLLTLDNIIYCIGGSNRRRASITTFCMFTPSTSKWLNLEPMRFARRSSGAVAVGQRIFVMGGIGRNSAQVRDMECYDVTTRQWSSLSLARMRSGTGNIIAHHFTGVILTVPRYGNLSEVQRYDITTDNWDEAKLGGADDFKIYCSLSVPIKFHGDNFGAHISDFLASIHSNFV